MTKRQRTDKQRAADDRRRAIVKDLNLPPRGPRGSAQNLERERLTRDALRTPARETEPTTPAREASAARYTPHQLPQGFLEDQLMSSSSSRAVEPAIDSPQQKRMTVMNDLHSTALKLRDEYPTPLSGENIAALTNAIAHSYAGDGWGLLKPGDKDRVVVRRDGVPMVPGVVFNRHTRATVTVLGDLDGAVKGQAEPLDTAAEDRWIESVERARVDPDHIEQTIPDGSSSASPAERKQDEILDQLTVILKELADHGAALKHIRKAVDRELIFAGTLDPKNQVIELYENPFKK